MFGNNSFPTFVDHCSDQFPTILDLIWLWDQKSEPVYVSVILLPTVVRFISLISKTHISRFFWLPAIYGPGIHGYLSTTYLWVSVDQISMDMWWPDIYEYLWSFCFARRESSCWIVDRYSCSFKYFNVTVDDAFFFLPGGNTVAIVLIAIPVLVNFPESLLTIHGVWRLSPTTIHSNPIHLICFSNPLHLQSTFLSLRHLHP